MLERVCIGRPTSYRDDNSNCLVYISETGGLAVVPAAGLQAPKEVKSPDWLHGMSCGTRKVGEKDFTKDTKKYGVEVFKDAHTGHTVYASETASLAIVPKK